MRAGKHFALFIVGYEELGPSVHVGVVRPIQMDMNDVGDTFSPLYIGAYNPRDQRTARWGTSEIHCCSFWLGSGRCWSTEWPRPYHEPDIYEWEGRITWNNSPKEKVGLLLDLDQGTLTAYDGSIKLGVIKEGLGGEYSWFTHIEEEKCSVSMERHPLPST